MLVRPLHLLADVGNVGEDGLLVAFTQALWRWDLVGPAAARGKVRVRVVEQLEEAVQQALVVDRLGLVVLPDARAAVDVAFLQARLAR